MFSFLPHPKLIFPTFAFHPVLSACTFICCCYSRFKLVCLVSLSLSRSPYLCLWSPFSFLSRISEINVAGWSQSNIWMLEGMLGLNGHGTESYIAAFNLGFSTFPIFKHCFFSVTLLSSKNTMSGKWWSTMSVNFSKPCRLDSEYQRLTNSSVYHELKEQAERIRT